MGKRKFNEKGRKVLEYVIDDTSTKQIKLDIPNDNEIDNYDKSNALVLPSKKRKTKIISKQSEITRILSKKQRKNLEKIVNKKKKKEGRSSLLDKLASVQLPVDELKQYTSIISVQTKGLKNYIKGDSKKVYVDSESTETTLSSTAGVKKKRRLDLLKGYSQDDSDDDENHTKPRDYNVIGFENSSSDDDSDDNTIKSMNESKSLEQKINDDKRNTQSEIVKEIIPVVKENLPEIIEKPKPKVYKPAVYVHVERTKEIQVARLKLPILSEEQVIMETINENSIIILAGETGSGKTTQIPQFLYEAGYAEKKLIAITEPRRVAAISMSKRVATEMNVGTDIVSYLIRFEGNVTKKTKIKFMTDGVLLKEVESDFILSNYSVVILDEAHERSVYTDILVGLLSRIVLLRQKQNNPLKLIIMSATLRVEDFTNNSKLFKTSPPILTVDTRQFPVTIHFNKYTNADYVKEAYKKAVKIHNKLPEGGILIFLTGQQEVNHVVKKLRKAFPYKNIFKSNHKSKTKFTEHNYSDPDDSDEFDMKKAIKNSKHARKKLNSQISLPNVNLDNYKLPSDDTDADLLDETIIKDDSDLDTDDDDNLYITGLKNTQPLWVLPLYSLLPSEKQIRVFESPPDGTRLCVVSTNVAETSLTIPNIKYVVDAGRQKTRLYDKITGVSSFVVTFTSKAAASQRAGRAGRTTPGHCYRLYSSAVYNDEFEDFAVPDIQKKPVDDLMLQMKCMGIDKVVNFPFPSPPDIIQLETAEQKLKLLGAIEEKKSSKSEIVFVVTPLGQAISAFPVAPRFGKMLALSHQHNLLPYTVCMVAALSVQEVLLEVSMAGEDSGEKSKWYKKRRTWAGDGNSLLLGDPVILLRAVGAAEYAGSMGKLEEFCKTNGLRPKAVAEIRKLRVQLTNEINFSMPDVNLFVDPKMEPPTDFQAKLLRQILLAGMGDQVARKICIDEISDREDKIKLKYGYRCGEMEEPVFMHSSNVLKKTQPEWVVYQEIYELQNGDSRKMFMRAVTAIEPEWLLIYVRSLCNVKQIKEDPMPKFNQKDGSIYCYVSATFGKAAWEIPLAEIKMPLSELAYRYFAMFFLNGDIFPKIKEYQKYLRATPRSVIKKWSKNTQHIVDFVNQLIRRQVTSREHLLDIWRKDSTFLLQEFCAFLVQVNPSDVAQDWPPIE